MLARLIALFSSPVGRIFRTLLSLILIVWILSSLDWSTLATIKGHLSYTLFVAALITALAAYPLCALRWQRLLISQAVPLSFAEAHRIVWIGQFYNAFLPGGIGGDAARLTHAFTAAPNARSAIVTATLLDRIIGVAALLLIGIVAMVLVTHGSGRATLDILPDNGLLLAGSGLALASLILLRWLPSQWTSALKQDLRDWRTLIAAITLSLAVWLIDFISGWLLARSLGMSIDFLTLSLALSAAYLSTLLPISLGGHGLREGTLLVALATLTSDPGNAAQFASLGFLFLVVTLLSSAAGGLALFFQPRQPAPLPLRVKPDPT